MSVGQMLSLLARETTRRHTRLYHFRTWLGGPLASHLFLVDIRLTKAVGPQRCVNGISVLAVWSCRGDGPARIASFQIEALESVWFGAHSAQFCCHRLSQPHG